MAVFPTFIVSSAVAAYAGLMLLLGLLPLLHVILLIAAAGLSWFCLLVSLVAIVEWTREKSILLHIFR